MRYCTKYMNPNDTAKTIPKMRTFANDLSAKRSGVAGAQTTQKTTVITTPVTPIPTENAGAIPPFHTFNNTHKTASLTVPAPNTAKAKNEPVTTSQAQQIISQSSTKSETTTESLPAVIITDTKRKRYSLTQSLSASMAEWVRTKKEEIRKSKVPKYTVASAERRRGVIQKATVKTGRESTADHEAVLLRIKAAKQIPHTPLVSAITTAPVIAHQPTWDSSTSIDTHLHKQATGLVTQKTQKVEGGVVPSPIAPTLETKSQVSNHVINTTQPKANSKTMTQILPAPITPRFKELEVALSIQPVIPTTISSTQPKIIPAVPHPISILPTSEPDLPAIKSNKESVTPVASYPSVFQSEYIDAVAIKPENKAPERRFAPPREPKRTFIDAITQTNQLVFISFGVLLFVVVTGLGMRSYLTSSNQPLETPPTTTPVATSTFETSSVAPTPFLVYSPQDLFNELKNQRAITDELFEITFISSLTNTIVSGEEFFAYVNAPIVFDFKKTVSAVTFGGYHGVPWITITVLDKTTALGGMLQWESTLASNLNPLFNETLSQSQNKFSDAIVGGNDVRILKNSSNEEVLVYGFINASTIIITSNTTSFINLATNFSNR